MRDDAVQRIQLDRLGKVIIHAGLDAALTIAHHRSVARASTAMQPWPAGPQQDRIEVHLHQPFPEIGRQPGQAHQRIPAASTSNSGRPRTPARTGQRDRRCAASAHARAAAARGRAGRRAALPPICRRCRPGRSAPNASSCRAQNQFRLAARHLLHHDIRPVADHLRRPAQKRCHRTRARTAAASRDREVHEAKVALVHHCAADPLGDHGKSDRLRRNHGLARAVATDCSRGVAMP